MPGPSPPPWKQNVEAMRACALPVAFASTDPVARRLSLALRTEALAPILRVGNAALLIDRLVIRSIHLEKILFSLDLILKFMALLFIVVFLAMLRKAYMGFLEVIVICHDVVLVGSSMSLGHQHAYGRRSWRRSRCRVRRIFFVVNGLEVFSFIRILGFQSKPALEE